MLRHHLMLVPGVENYAALQGDFNAVWRDADANNHIMQKRQTSRTLHHIIESHHLTDLGLKQLPVRFTWFLRGAQYQASRIDYIFTNIKRRRLRGCGLKGPASRRPELSTGSESLIGWGCRCCRWRPRLGTSTMTTSPWLHLRRLLASSQWRLWPPRGAPRSNGRLPGPHRP